MIFQKKKKANQNLLLFSIYNKKYNQPTLISQLNDIERPCILEVRERGNKRMAYLYSYLFIVYTC